MVDPSRSKVNGGQGIGLATVKSIIESHNGRVEVKSQYGSGSTFIIKLPL
jgi:signal transduction histidine kinase